MSNCLDDVLLYLHRQCSGLFPAGDTCINLAAVSRRNDSSSLCTLLLWRESRINKTQHIHLGVLTAQRRQLMLLALRRLVF